MNNKKSIEEIAKVMCGNDCEECARESAEFYKQTIEEARNNHCLLRNCAKTLYNAGYRKLPENAVVLTREEYKQLLDNAIRVDMEYLDQELAKARKETAREILELLVPDCEICEENWHKGCLCLRTTIAEKIAKQYGIEIKE